MTNKNWWQTIWGSHPKADDLPEPIFVEIPVEDPEKVPHVVHIPVKAATVKKPKERLTIKKPKRPPTPSGLRRGKQPAKGKRK
jgi:hypothetical protein